MSTRTKVVILVLMVVLVVGLIVLDKVANQPSAPLPAKPVHEETVEMAKPTTPTAPAINPTEETSPSLPKTGTEITPSPLATTPKSVETAKERGGDYGVEVKPLVTPQTPSISPIAKPTIPVVTPPAAPQIVGYETYILKKGEDNWSVIAQHKLGDASKFTIISNANPKLLTKDLKPGTKIQVPKLAPPGVAPIQQPPAPSKGGPTFVPPTTSGETEFGMKPTKSTYTVKRGDTLSSIAKRELGSEKKWKDLYNANKDKIKDKDNLRVGTILTLPQKGATSTALSTFDKQHLLAIGPSTGGAIRGTSYTVQKGDSLWSIAQKVYGKGSYKKILDANKDKLPEGADTVLQPGMVLTTP